MSKPAALTTSHPLWRQLPQWSRQSLRPGERRSGASATGSLRDPDLLVQLGNIFLAALLFRQLIVFFRVLPDGMYDYNIFRNAGLAVVHGHSPFSVDGFIYPATAALAFVPFGLVSFTLGGSIFAVLIILSLVATLWILGIRD